MWFYGTYGTCGCLWLNGITLFDIVFEWYLSDLEINLSNKSYSRCVRACMRYVKLYIMYYSTFYTILYTIHYTIHYTLYTIHYAIHYTLHYTTPRYTTLLCDGH